MTKYPTSYDDNTSLPPATGDDAASVNDAIGAIEAIEQAMGLLPMGIYASIRTRLDILEARINNPFAPAPTATNPFFVGNTGVTIQAGIGDPNVLNIHATPGSLWLREDGYAGQDIYSFNPDGYWQLVGLADAAPFMSYYNNGLLIGQYNAVNFVNNIVGSSGATGINISATGIPTGVWIQNSGATLGQFGNINLEGGIVGTTGPGNYVNLSVPVPGTPAYNPSWYAATNIYWDPAGTSGGSDSNTGLTSGSPVLTFAEIIRRYGSTSPLFNYGQSVIINQLSSQPAGQDPVFFEPKLSGGAYAALVGTLTVVHAAFTGGTVTVKTPSTGTLLQVASMPGGTAANQYVYNQTRGSYAFIDSMLSSTATMQQPMTAASLTTISSSEYVIDDTWTTGDTLVIYSLPNVNLKKWQPHGSDVSSGGAYNLSWVQWVSIADTSGNATALLQSQNDTAETFFSGCIINPRIHIDGGLGRGSGTVIQGCSMLGAVVILGECLIGGGGSAVSIGIWSAGAGNINAYAIIHGVTTINGEAGLGSVYFDNQIRVHSPISMNGIIFGPGVALVYAGGQWTKNQAATWATSFYLTGSPAMAFADFNASRAYGSVITSTGQILGGIAITPAYLDTYNSITCFTSNASFSTNAIDTTAPTGIIPPTLYYYGQGLPIGQFNSVNLSNNLIGITGATGINVSVTGISTGIWVQNNSATLGQFSHVNLLGGLAGVTGPGGYVNISATGVQGPVNQATTTWQSSGLSINNYLYMTYTQASGAQGPTGIIWNTTTATYSGIMDIIATVLATNNQTGVVKIDINATVQMGATAAIIQQAQPYYRGTNSATGFQAVFGVTGPQVYLAVNTPTAPVAGATGVVKWSASVQQSLLQGP